MLLTGPFGGLTDDVREFLLCLADEGLPSPGGASSTRPACGSCASGCPAGALGQEFLDLPDAAQLGFVFAAWWEGSTGATGRPSASWDACSGTSVTACSRSWPACRDVPARMSPSPAWFALTGTAPALLAAAAMAGPALPPPLAAASQN